MVQESFSPRVRALTRAPGMERWRAVVDRLDGIDLPREPADTYWALVDAIELLGRVIRADHDRVAGRAR